MKRQQKYPDTATFHYHNENPRGRITGDCVYRAIAKATGKKYAEVVMDGARMHAETGYPADYKKGIELLLKRYGFTMHSQPRKADGTKYTGKEFCEFLRKNCTGNVVANIGGHHTTAFIWKFQFFEFGGYKCFDIWDCTDKCVGNYWTKD